MQKKSWNRLLTSVAAVSLALSTMAPAAFAATTSLLPSSGGLLIGNTFYSFTYIAGNTSLVQSALNSSGLTSTYLDLGGQIANFGSFITSGGTPSNSGFSSYATAHPYKIPSGITVMDEQNGNMVQSTYSANSPDFTTVPTATEELAGALIKGMAASNVTTLTITDLNQSSISETFTPSELQSGNLLLNASIGDQLLITPVINGTLDTVNAVTVTVAGTTSSTTSTSTGGTSSSTTTSTTTGSTSSSSTSTNTTSSSTTSSTTSSETSGSTSSNGTSTNATSNNPYFVTPPSASSESSLLLIKGTAAFNVTSINIIDESNAQANLTGVSPTQLQAGVGMIGVTNGDTIEVTPVVNGISETSHMVTLTVSGISSVTTSGSTTSSSTSSSSSSSSSSSTSSANTSSQVQIQGSNLVVGNYYLNNLSSNWLYLFSQLPFYDHSGNPVSFPTNKPFIASEMGCPYVVDELKMLQANNELSKFNLLFVNSSGNSINSNVSTIINYFVSNGIQLNPSQIIMTNTSLYSLNGAYPTTYFPFGSEWGYVLGDAEGVINGILGSFNNFSGSFPANNIAYSTGSSGAWTQLGGDYLQNNPSDPNQHNSSNVTSVTVTPSGKIVTGTWGGVFEWNGSAWTQLGGDYLQSDMSDPYPSSSGIYVSVTSSGAIVAGTGDGVFEWNGSTWTQLGGSLLSDPNQQYSSGITSLSITPSGNIVAGTYDGVFEWSGSKWIQLGGNNGYLQTNPSDANQHYSSDVTSVTVTPNGAIVAGVNRDGVFEWNGSKWS